MKKIVKKLVLLSIIFFSLATFTSCLHTPKDTNIPSFDSQKNVKKEFPGKYVEYSLKIIEESNNQGKKIVLFFHASWCPTCRAAEEKILSRINEIPENIVIVKTDYDTYTDLKKKYNITYQHTFVQIDNQGNEVTAWNGGSLDEIIKRVK